MAKTQVLLKIIVNLKGFFIGIYNFSLFSLVSVVYKPMECTEGFGMVKTISYGGGEV